MKKNQSLRLTIQHKHSKGVIGIFGDEAKRHDAEVSKVSKLVLEALKHKYPQLEFRHRKSIAKKEINAALQRLDPNSSSRFNLYAWRWTQMERIGNGRGYDGYSHFVTSDAGA